MCQENSDITSLTVILANATHRMWEMSREDTMSVATSIQSLDAWLYWILVCTRMTSQKI